MTRGRPPRPQAIRDIIMARYGDQVRQLQQQWCPGCGSMTVSHCLYRLLPVTTRGDRCPYYTPKPPPPEQP